MRVGSVSVANFRLLADIKMHLEKHSTVLVGRNNTGKTSLADAIVEFLKPSNINFSIADFSTESYANFMAAYKLFRQGKEVEARKALPEISITIDIHYDRNQPDFGPLSHIIVDLDPECELARARFRYALPGGKMTDLFDGLAENDSDEVLDLEGLLTHIGDRIPRLYERAIDAIDPEDETNTRSVTIESIRELIKVDFLGAQRGLDDDKNRPKELISRVFQSLYSAASAAAEESGQRKTAEELSEAIKETEKSLGAKVEQVMSDVVPALERFGYPGLNGQRLSAKTELNVERLLANYTSVQYAGVAGVSLPESYSGLGSRNLVLILLTLLSYYRSYISRAGVPGVHLVFIEEPEAHLHPQMQEVFIDQLSGLCRVFPEIDSISHEWPVQFVVSTHSSHVANKAPFSAIRYFLVKNCDAAEAGKRADIKDLSQAGGLNEKFLHQYLTLTKSDLFFADKAILVEGTSERLIIPKAIEKCAIELCSQYVTILEIGGAHSYLFFPLLDFLQLPTLVVTDIDSVARSDDAKRDTRSLVHEGTGTSNTTIKNWFNDVSVSLSTLLAQAETPTIIQENRYLAYQVGESPQAACGRSFEEAFILANAGIFGISDTGDTDEMERTSSDEAARHKKSQFAVRFAVDETAWNTPRYIARGLRWLLEYPKEKEIDRSISPIASLAAK